MKTLSTFLKEAESVESQPGRKTRTRSSAKPNSSQQNKRGIEKCPKRF